MRLDSNPTFGHAKRPSFCTVSCRPRSAQLVSSTSATISSASWPCSLEQPRGFSLAETTRRAGSTERRANFRLTVNAVADWSRVSYQRLALLAGGASISTRSSSAFPTLIDSFERLDMVEDALKCRFIEGLARVEMGELSLAGRRFERAAPSSRAQLQRQPPGVCAGVISSTSTECSGILSRRWLLEAGSAYSAQAWKADCTSARCTGASARSSGQRDSHEAAIEAYGSARDEFAVLGMVADVAATRLMIADLHLELVE